MLDKEENENIQKGCVSERIQGYSKEVISEGVLFDTHNDREISL